MINFISKELLGLRLKRARKFQGLSARVLAEKCGYDTMTVYSYENAHNYPNIQMFFKVCDTLNLSNVWDVVNPNPNEWEAEALKIGNN